MSFFEVHGNKKLAGNITPQGAKNEALQVISAVLLTTETVTIHNIPDILDVNLLIELLHDMNVQVTKMSRHSYSFTAKNVDENYLASEAFSKKGGKLRGSVMLAGPMLKLVEEDLIHILLDLKN